MTYSIKIPLNPVFIKMITNAISNAYFLYQDHIDEENFPTDNGSEGEIWNYINKSIIWK